MYSISKNATIMGLPLSSAAQRTERLLQRQRIIIITIIKLSLWLIDAFNHIHNMTTGQYESIPISNFLTCNQSPHNTAKRCTNLLEYICTWRITVLKGEMDFPSSSSSSGDRMSKNHMMNEVRNQVAMATAQELIQVIYYNFNTVSISH